MEKKKVAKDEFLKGLSYVPFPLLIILMIGLFAFGIFATVYASVGYVALESAMIFLIMFGVAVLSIGVGLLLIDVYLKYAKRFAKPIDETPAPAKTTVATEKKMSITYQNICLIVMAVGAVFILISAGLGAISPDDWRNEIGEYRVSHGYNAQSKTYDVKYDTTNPDKPINRVSLDLDGKNVVVIYTEDDDFVSVKGYETFSGQLTINYVGGTVKITENAKPTIDTNDSVAKMLFFLLEENDVEAQIRLYIPVELKDTIEIDGEYIVAQE